MESAITMRDLGIRFHVPRRTRMGRTPRIARGRRWTKWGLRHVDLEVSRGEVLGVIGANGSGKTTLLRAMAGIYRADDGHIKVAGRVGPLLTASAGLRPVLSGWENISLAGVLLGLSRAETTAVADAVADFSGLGDFLDAQVRVYSAGMKSRLGFSLALHSQPDILVLDEVLDVGDEEFRRKSFERLKAFITKGGTVVVASHEIEHLVSFADRIVLLMEGRIAEDGEPRTVAGHYLSDPTGHHKIDRRKASP